MTTTVSISPRLHAALDMLAARRDESAQAALAVDGFIDAFPVAKAVFATPNTIELVPSPMLMEFLAPTGRRQ